MKPIALLAVLWFTFPSLAATEERVSKIRGWYETIQKAKPTTERKIPFGDGEEPDNGDLTVRDYEGGWKAITLTVNAEHGGADKRFYYKDGSLFFAHVSTTHWQFAGKKDDGTHVVADTRKEERYYYEGENCVRQLTRSATSTSAEQEPAAELAKAEQKRVKPGEGAEKLRRKAIALLHATTAGAVMRALELD